MNNEKNCKSNIKYYFITWTLLIGSLIFIKYIMDINTFILNMILIPIIGIIVLIIRFQSKLKISTYIDRFHKEKWDDIYKRFGIHGRGTEIIPRLFLFSDEYYNDPILKRLKQNYKECMSFSYIVIVSYFVYLIRL